ncbi:amidohydrolase family protein [Paraburkholderia sp. J67]|uniref:amidohydrolase family protein n=1 Tax=Paraburkholderia sp. J67 TaxID=2805435 RepID=UPI002ABE2D53|nr:amidohydrolase family protein [Paraburkholderia sp. J67]
MKLIDIHPHIISDDESSYPPAPLFGKRSEWSQERPNTVDSLIEAMNAAGVEKAAVVHSSTTYGFDNRYVVDSCRRYRDRLVAVGSVDMLADDVTSVIGKWADAGLAGLRIFTGGSTKDFDPGELENPKSFRAWDILAELKLPMCIQTGPIGLPQVRMLARKYPGVDIVLDHLARPDVLDGAPYANAASLFALADLPNIYLKLTPRIFGDVKKGNARAETFFPRVVEAFGAQRMAWGSNFPTSPGTLTEIVAEALQGLDCLSEDDRAWVFGKTAQKLYPALG